LEVRVSGFRDALQPLGCIGRTYPATTQIHLYADLTIKQLVLARDAAPPAILESL
jgi:hypothetical protein